MAHAETTSGAVPLLARDTAPSVNRPIGWPAPTDQPFRLLMGPAVEDTVSPPREEKQHDASKLSFPIQMLIASVVMTAAIIGSVYGMTGGIRESQLRTESDMRDLRTRMEYQQKVDEAENRSQAAVFDNMNTTVTQLRSQVQLLQLQYAELSKQILQRQR